MSTPSAENPFDVRHEGLNLLEASFPPEPLQAWQRSPVLPPATAWVSEQLTDMPFGASYLLHRLLLLSAGMIADEIVHEDDRRVIPIAILCGAVGVGGQHLDETLEHLVELDLLVQVIVDGVIGYWLPPCAFEV